MGRGDPGRGGDGRAGRSGGPSGFHAETLLNLRPGEPLDPEGAPLDLDLLLGVGQVATCAQFERTLEPEVRRGVACGLVLGGHQELLLVERALARVQRNPPHMLFSVKGFLPDCLEKSSYVVAKEHRPVRGVWSDALWVRGKPGSRLRFRSVRGLRGVHDSPRRLMHDDASIVSSFLPYLDPSQNCAMIPLAMMIGRDASSPSCFCWAHRCVTRRRSPAGGYFRWESY